jgi:hypothetical protein
MSPIAGPIRTALTEAAAITIVSVRISTPCRVEVSELRDLRHPPELQGLTHAGLAEAGGDAIER